VVALANARLAEARQRAEEQDKKDREAAEKKRRDAEQAERDEQAKRAESLRKKDADKEASCSSDRIERRRHVQDAIERAVRERARANELEAYVSRSCTRKDVQDFTDQQYVDDKGYVRTRQVQTGKHEEIACPPDAPPELRPGGSGFPTGVVAIQASADERAKNERCQDVQDLLKK
jgi:sugar-specific transcriptional regulator TrmB